jgi:hypothetical protein
MSDTSPTDPVAETFEAQRDRLRAVAYRMLGPHTDAEDAVQEAWLRLSHQDRGPAPGRAGSPFRDARRRDSGDESAHRDGGTAPRGRRRTERPVR